MFHLKYFLFFLINIAWSYVSQMILSAVCTSNFFQAIFLQVVRVVFTTFGTCLSSSTGFPVLSIFLAFEAPQDRCDLVLNILKTIADLHLLGSTGLIKCEDVSVGLDSFFAFSNRGSSYICNSLFFQDWCYFLLCCQCQLPTPDKFFGSVEFLMRVGSAFCRMKAFHFNMLFACFLLPTSTSKLPFLVFLTAFGVALAEITFSMWKGENLAWQTSPKIQ